MRFNHSYWMNEAIKVVKDLQDEVPVCALIVKDNKLISTATNKVELQNDPTAHAEILAIREASKVLGSWRLNDCILYVTLEPCSMCMGAIINSRISTVVFGAYDTSNLITRHCEEALKEPTWQSPDVMRLLRRNKVAPRNDVNVEVIGGILELEASKLLKDFFEVRR